MSSPKRLRKFNQIAVVSNAASQPADRPSCTFCQHNTNHPALTTPRTLNSDYHVYHVVCSAPTKRKHQPMITPHSPHPTNHTTDVKHRLSLLNRASIHPETPPKTTSTNTFIFPVPACPLGSRPSRVEISV